MPFFFKRSRKKLTRLFFSTDVHGSERTFRKFVNAGKFYDVDVLVLGGDLSGKLLIPILDEGQGRYRASLQGRTERVETQEELQELLGRIGTLGFYAKIMPEDEFRAIRDSPEAVDQLFHELARERLESWIELAEERLRGTGITCFVTGGNDDEPDVLRVLREADAESIVNCEGELVDVDEHHTMVSVGYSTTTPWHTPREVTDERLGEMIEDAVAPVPDYSRCIFNFHDPPVDSTLDTCPMLDWDTDPPEVISKAGQPVLHSAGSRSVRDAIEKYQPLLGLHGHIHESKSVARIGNTLCVNPGSEYGEGVLRGCIVTFADGQIEGHQMTSG